MPEDEANNIKQCDVREREREETFGQNRIAQTKLEVRQSVSRTRTGRQGKQREREREKPQCSQHSYRRTSGDAGLETVSNETQPKTSCRAEKPHAP